jgi:hypothetical protein
MTAVAMNLKASLGLIEEAEDVEPEIDRLRGEGADALLVVADPIIDNLRERIAEAAIARGLPTAGQISFYADAGFLLTYAPALSAMHRRAAIFVDRRGACRSFHRTLPSPRPERSSRSARIFRRSRVALRAMSTKF